MKRPSPPFQVRTAGLVDRWKFHSTPGTRQGDIMLTVFLAGRGIYRKVAPSLPEASPPLLRPVSPAFQ